MNLQVDCPPTWRNSPITFCGEAPGEDECWLKEGFVGKAGDVARRICAGGGVDFNTVNLVNVALRRPQDNDFMKAFYETVKSGKKKSVKPTAELLEWYKNLAAELLLHRPKVVVACGNEALRALVGLDQIIRRQGSVYDSTLVPGLKVVAMQHPSAILHNKKWQDIYMSARIVKQIVVPESKCAELVTRLWSEKHGHSIESIVELFQDAVRHQWRWVIDIETRGGGIACIGIGFSGGRSGDETALIVPIETTTGPYYGIDDELGFWHALQWLSDNNPNLVLQNAPYDLDWLMDYGFIAQHVLIDTMTVHHLMYPELPKKLEVLNWFYPTGIPYYKDEGKTWGKKDPDERTWTYCAKDLVSELRVSYLEEAELKGKGLWDIYQNEVMSSLPIALEMQRRGFSIDDIALRDTNALVDIEYRKVHNELTSEVGHEINVGSPKQVSKLLYTELGFPKLYGKSNADEDVLVTLKSWLLGQRPQAHTKKCKSTDDRVFTSSICKHRTAEWLSHMAITLEHVMRERKLMKAKSSYLDEDLYVDV